MSLPAVSTPARGGKPAMSRVTYTTFVDEPTGVEYVLVRQDFRYRLWNTREVFGADLQEEIDNWLMPEVAEFDEFEEFSYDD